MREGERGEEETGKESLGRGVEAAGRERSAWEGSNPELMAAAATVTGFSGVDEAKRVSYLISLS